MVEYITKKSKPTQLSCCCEWEETRSIVTSQDSTAAVIWMSWGGDGGGWSEGSHSRRAKSWCAQVPLEECTWEEKKKTSQKSSATAPQSSEKKGREKHHLAEPCWPIWCSISHANVNRNNSLHGLSTPPPKEGGKPVPELGRSGHSKEFLPHSPVSILSKPFTAWILLYIFILLYLSSDLQNTEPPSFCLGLQ